MWETIKKTSRGFSLLELMFAMAIGLTVLAATIGVFVRQSEIVRDENDGTKIRAKGRQAIHILAREVRMAGYGLPPTQAIAGYAQASEPTMTEVLPDDLLPPTVNSIRFRINLENVRTFLDLSASGVSSASSTISVIDSSLFSSGDRIALFSPDDQTTWDENLLTIDSVSGNDISFAPVLIHTYNPDHIPGSVQVAKFIDYEIRLDEDNRQIVKSAAGLQTNLVNEVALATDNGLLFDFNGAETPAEVERIGIQLNLVDGNNPDAIIEFKTDVAIRNSYS